MGSIGNTSTELTVSGVPANIVKLYENSVFSEKVGSITVKPFAASEFLRDSWDGTPNDLHKESAKIINHYLEKNSLNPKEMTVGLGYVAVYMPDGTEIYTILAEPSGFATKNMSSYIRLYQLQNGKKKQIKKSEW